MITKQNKIILASVLAISLASLSLIAQPQIFAEETDEPKYNRANDVTIKAVFSFRDVTETSNGFQIFTQTAGFNRDSQTPIFKLEGALDSDRVYLYEAADMTFKRGITDIQHKYGQFNVDVYLQKEGITLRHLGYVDCRITDYKVETRSDKEEGWTTSKGFSTIDEFQFECSGYSPHNPLFDLMKNDGYTTDTKSSLDLKDTQTWSNQYK